MSDVYIRVKKYIEDNSLIKGNDSVLAAVSGGADSICMLFLLHQYSIENGIKMGVVCVDHGFRPEAAKEAEYVGRICKENEIDFFLRKIEAGACAKTEEAARLFRYQLIKDVALENNYNKIALAHNANDRAETFLFNVFRGTGLRGLTSIRPVRDEFIRPILCLKRSEIEDYLFQRKIEFCIDSSNLEDDYSRNKIRHHILPISTDINSSSVEHMNELAEHMSKVDAYINARVKEQFGEIVEKKEDGFYILTKDYIKLDELIRYELIRYILTKMTPHLKDITSAHIEDIDALFLRGDNAQIHLPYDIKAYREYGHIFIGVKKKSEPIKEMAVSFSEMFSDGGESEVDIKLTNDQILHLKLIEVEHLEQDPLKSMPRNKYTKWFDYDKIIDTVCIRNRRDMDYIVIDNEGHTKSIAKLMIHQKIPERMRDNIPIIAAESEVIWVIGYRESFAYRIDENTKKIIEMSLEE